MTNQWYQGGAGTGGCGLEDRLAVIPGYFSLWLEDFFTRPEWEIESAAQLSKSDHRKLRHLQTTITPSRSVCV